MTTTNMKSAFLVSVGEYLREVDGRTDVAEVISAVEETESDGYCTSCYYEQTTIKVVYLDTAGAEQRATIYEDFGSLVRWLTGYDRWSVPHTG